MSRKGFTPRQVLEVLINTPDELLDKPIMIYNVDDDEFLECYIQIEDVTLDDNGKAMAIYCKPRYE